METLDTTEILSLCVELKIHQLKKTTFSNHKHSGTPLSKTQLGNAEALSLPFTPDVESRTQIFQVTNHKAGHELALG